MNLEVPLPPPIALCIRAGCDKERYLPHLHCGVTCATKDGSFDVTNLRNKFRQLKADHQLLRVDHESLQENYNSLQENYDCLQENYDSLRGQLADTLSKYPV